MVIILVVVGAALPWLDVDNASRVTMLVIAAVLAVVWWNSSFERRRKPASDGEAPVDRSEAIGKAAGRLAGNAAKAIRDRSARRDER